MGKGEEIGEGRRIARERMGEEGRGGENEVGEYTKMQDLFP